MGVIEATGMVEREKKGEEGSDGKRKQQTKRRAKVEERRVSKGRE